MLYKRADLANNDAWWYRAKIKGNNGYIRRSTRFLRKSPHYYSAMKSKGSDATTDVLIDLATAMSTQREFLQQYDTTTIYEARWQKWIDIEAKVAKELALRATKRGTMSNYALNQFKNALQSIPTVHAAA